MTPEDSQKITDNLARIRERIASATSSVGRSSSDIRLVAVTKYVDAEVTRVLYDAGCVDLGESRPQQLWSRSEALSDLHPRWHLVGHLQRNKVARTLPLTSLIHSVDSLRLAREIDREAEKLDCAANVLLEVNISGDSAKHGFEPAGIEPALSSMSDCTNLNVQGLMAMAHREGGLDVARRDFASLRELRDRLVNSCPENASLAQLSMGMSGDFEAAIAEGATILRIGSALFEGVER